MTSLEKASLDETKTCGIRTRLWNAVSSLYNLFTFSFVNPLLKKGSANQLDEHSAVTVNPLTESIEELTNKFYQIFNKLEEDANGTKKTYLMNPVLYSLIKQHACLLCTQFVLSALLVCSRLLSPLTIRWFLIWLDDYKDGEADKHNGWFWGILLISSTILTTMIHNQGFWVSFIVGWKSKMSMIAAVHAKLLTLNTSSVAKVTIGHVVNLSSNDAERFSEASIFWPFLLLGPLETIMILILLSFVLGFLPAAAGLSFTLVLIPLQSMLSQQIAKLRRKTTKITDRRINFMSEMISGSLAVKMLGWEDPLLEEVDGIRKQEHRMLKKMNYIKANSLSITGHIQTIMACATFVVYRFTGNEFNIPDVLFAISLFSLPRMSLAFMFTMAVQTLSELLVSTRRLSDFFRLPEVNQIAIVKNEALQRGEVVIQNGHYGWYSVKNNDTKMQKSTKILKKISNKVWSKKNKESQLEAPELIPTLRNICLHVKPGELVGIAGKVGSGKSSLLYALLNDMENLNPHHIVQMTGSVSYCAQVPSIIAATVRENIVFGNEFNEDIYNQVISSCALDVDLEKNPTGRILNRFSKDTGVQDDELPQNVGDVLILTLQAIGTMIIVSIALPYMIPVLIMIIFLVRKLRNYYVVTSREIRRYDGTTRSPVYAMLSSNIKALPTIHAFEKEENFQAMFQRALDLNGSWWIAFLATSRWIAFRMDGFVSAVCALTVILSVALVDQVSKEVLGLALVYIVASSGTLQWWMRQTADLENRMTSIERNLEYTKLDQEPPRASEGGGNAPSNWPYNGTIEYSSVTAVYRPGLEPVLKQLQFVIPGGSSVGIVGRTGSGKSSLLLSLFRLIDINEGRIFIDSVDTSSIGIDVLRKQLAIIPQDPVLFGGSFRSNLDPWNEFSDAQVWAVLSRVHLEETVKAFGGINAPVAECGNNLSVGQRQLLCLARALLADSKILALDEATANVDRTTDAMIQDALHSTTVRNEKTLLIIAHRIDTVLDCDLILVLDSGRVAEFGSPVSLLSRENGLFKRMVDATKENAEIKGHEKGT
eukprot:g7118.t1